MLENRFFFIKTYGCQMNSYDSTKMANLLTTNLGMSAANEPDHADLVIVNTCSIREKAQEKVFSELGKWRKNVLKNPDVVIALAGCVATQEAEDIFRRNQNINIVIGPQSIHKLADLYTNFLNSNQQQIDISFPEIEKFDNLPQETSAQPSAYVSIMEGCNQYCSYCIVPYTRGEEISRPYVDVLKEAQHLASIGAKEIILLGQNVNAYLGKLPNEELANLSLLIQGISKIDNIERIRFTTSHPAAFDQTLIEAYALESKLCNHLHLPVQSGSNRILKAMKRDYTKEQFITITEELREIRPNLPISTDIIIGFPGETEADFLQTMDLVNTVNFDQSFSFIYSPRPGTPAAEIDDPTPLSEKKARLHALQAQLLSNAQKISSAMVGKTHKVLVEAKSKRNQHECTGRTENNRVVNFPGGDRLIGHIIDIHITSMKKHTLYGELTSITEHA